MSGQRRQDAGPRPWAWVPGWATSESATLPVQNTGPRSHPLSRAAVSWLPGDACYGQEVQGPTAGRDLTRRTRLVGGSDGALGWGACRGFLASHLFLTTGALLRRTVIESYPFMVQEGKLRPRTAQGLSPPH